MTDLTFVATWAGVAYVCFIVDAFSRMIVGWRVAGHMRTPMVLDAIEMARWNRGLHHPGLRCHSDAGSQFTSIRYGERLAEIGAVPSIGTVGDSYDNALAETVNGYYKAELIRGPARSGPWKTVEEVELATLGWVHWHNTQRLHGYLGDLPPAEFEAAPRRPDRQGPRSGGAIGRDRPLAGPQNASHSLDPDPIERSDRARARCSRGQPRTPPHGPQSLDAPATPPEQSNGSTDNNIKHQQHHSPTRRRLRYPPGRSGPGSTDKTPEPPSNPGRLVDPVPDRSVSKKTKPRHSGAFL